MKRTIAIAMVLILSAMAGFGDARFRNAGALLVSETITNRVIESGEDVIVSLALKNVGDEPVSNLIATLQATAGMTTPDPPTQTYGTLLPWEPSVAREFSFKATAPANSLLILNLALEDSGRSLGMVPFRFRVGPQITMATNSDDIFINHVGIADPYPSVLTISNAPGTITDISVTLSNLSHAYPDDLDILLVSPSGDSVILMSDACGGVPFDHVTLTFSDSALASLPDGDAPASPLVKPTNFGLDDSIPDPAPMGPYASVLSAFNGKIANGDWKLFIVDDFSGDDGELFDGWSLTIKTLQPVDAVPTLTLLPRGTNNTIRFSVSGRPGHTYAIESGPDAIQSAPLESFIMPAGGSKVFEYPLELSDRFFRASTDP